MGGEPDKSASAKHREPVRDGKLRSDQTAHLGAQHIRYRHRRPGEAAVQLGQQLILRCGPGLDPAATLTRRHDRCTIERRNPPPEGVRRTARQRQILEGTRWILLTPPEVFWKEGIRFRSYQSSLGFALVESSEA